MENSLNRFKVMQSLITVLKNNLMIILFAALAIFTFTVSGQTAYSMTTDIIARFFRNILLVLALILPVVAGVGLNFGITLGAIASQIALIIVLALGAYKTKTEALLLWTILTLNYSPLSGYSD